MKETKTEMLHIRTYPRYKKWGNGLAGKKGLTLAQYLNDHIRQETWKMICEEAYEIAVQLAAVKNDVPLKEVNKMTEPEHLFTRLGIEMDVPKQLEIRKLIYEFNNDSIESLKTKFEFGDEDYKGTSLTSNDFLSEEDKSQEIHRKFFTVTFSAEDLKTELGRLKRFKEAGVNNPEIIARIQELEKKD